VLRKYLNPILARLQGGPNQSSAPGGVLLWVLRGCFGAIVIGIAMLAFRQFSEPDNDTTSGWLAFATVLAIGFLIVLTDVLVRNKQITTVSAIYFGLLLGLLLGNILSSALDPFIFDWESRPTEAKSQGPRFSASAPRPGPTPEPLLPDEAGLVVGAVARAIPSPQPKEEVSSVPSTGSAPSFSQRTQAQRRALTLFITVICCYISISTLLQTKDEFRFIIPYVEFSKQVKGGRPLVLDTSVIIDGRIADICDTRFIDNKMIVPRFVLQELQSVADSSDKLKRNRGRRGLDMLKRMQNNPKVELQIHEANLPELREVHKVDERLVVMAKALGARVVTNDYNLNKIAQLQGVEVINLNELANALKSVALPGEAMNVRLVKQGDQIGQGVGYLEDGTMVVVEQGRPYIGQDVTITVTSVLQTPAGRMIFGRIDPRPPDHRPTATAAGGQAG
jgi:uncharacterized protein YacL